MEKMLRMLDLEVKRTDELLSQMIPAEIAVKLRKGEALAGLCQVGIIEALSTPQFSNRFGKMSPV